MYSILSCISRGVTLPGDPVSTVDTVNTARNCALNFSELYEWVLTFNDVTFSEIDYTAVYHIGLFVCLFVCLCVCSTVLSAASRMWHEVQAGTCHVHVTLGKHNALGYVF